MNAGTEQKSSLPERLSAFLQRNRRALSISLVVLLVAAAAIFGYLEFSSRRAETALRKVEQARELYDQLQSVEEEHLADMTNELNSLLQEIQTRYTGTYAAARAYFISAELSWNDTNYETAAEQFRALAQNHPRSHLAPRALLLAGQAYEELGELDLAIESYTRLVESHGAEAPETPRALFALGRLAEQQDDTTTALVHYNQLVQDFSGAAWTNLARNRIIYLETRN